MSRLNHMHMRNFLIGCLFLGMLGWFAPAMGQNSFTGFITNSPQATTPLGPNDLTPVIQNGATKHLVGPTGAVSSVTGAGLTVCTPTSGNVVCSTAGAGNSNNYLIANAASTGTTLNKLAKLTGSPSTAVITATTDTSGALGVVTSGAGTTGIATIQFNGTANCVFDGATIAGDAVQISPTVAGDCHDSGTTAPASGEIIGIVLTSNAGAGTYNLAITVGAPPQVQGTFADPRNFGSAYSPARPFNQICASGLFNVNDGTHDDGPAIRAALATGLPVVIPWPGCKVITTIQAQLNGWHIFGFGGGGQYNQPQSGVETLPELYIPDASALTGGCAIDVNGLDGGMLDHLTIKDATEGNGQVALCNSQGICCGYPQAFTDVAYVSFVNLGNGIGSAMSNGDPIGHTGCTPTGSLGNPVLQMRITHSHFINNCYGIYGNLSDMIIESSYFGDQDAQAIATPGGGGVSTKITNNRFEYNGYGANYGSQNQGTTVLLPGSRYIITDNDFDHNAGPCLWLGNASVTSVLDRVANNHCNNWQINSPYTDYCAYVIQNFAGLDAYANGATWTLPTPANTPPPHIVCFKGGSASSAITWEAIDGAVGWTSRTDTYFRYDTALGAPYKLDVGNVQHTIYDPGIPDVIVPVCQPAPSNTLPTASASTGQCYTVTNANGPTLGSAVVQTGAAWAQVTSNGAAWNVSAK